MQVRDQRAGPAHGVHGRLAVPADTHEPASELGDRPGHWSERTASPLQSQEMQQSTITLSITTLPELTISLLLKSCCQDAANGCGSIHCTQDPNFRAIFVPSHPLHPMNHAYSLRGAGEGGFRGAVLVHLWGAIALPRPSQHHPAARPGPYRCQVTLIMTVSCSELSMALPFL